MSSAGFPDYLDRPDDGSEDERLNPWGYDPRTGRPLGPPRRVPGPRPGTEHDGLRHPEADRPPAGPSPAGYGGPGYPPPSPAGPRSGQPGHGQAGWEEPDDVEPVEVPSRYPNAGDGPGGHAGPEYGEAGRSAPAWVGAEPTERIAAVELGDPQAPAAFSPDHPARRGGRRRRNRLGEVPGLSNSWWRQGIVYLMLAVMATADGVWFWITLAGMLRRYSYALPIVVAALALGALALAHGFGRLARTRAAGYPASVLWTLALFLLWLSLGGSLGWIRAYDTSASAPTATGPLAHSVQQSSGPTVASVQLAALLLCLYLATGALAATHAYHLSDPRSVEVRKARRQLEKLSRNLARRRYEEMLAGRLVELRQTEIKQDQDAHDRAQAVTAGLGDEVREGAYHRMATSLADPEATDGLFPGQGHRPDHPQADPTDDPHDLF